MPESRPKLRQLAGGVRNRVSDRLTDLWWWFLIRGLLVLGLGVVALFWPQKTVGILVGLLGVFLMADGAIGCFGALRHGVRSGFPVWAAASFAAGAVLLFWTDVSVRVFLVLVGAWALFQGGSLYLSSRDSDSDREARQWAGSVGAALALIGLVLIVWPNTGVVAVSWLIALVALLTGLLLVWLAAALRRISLRISRED